MGNFKSAIRKQKTVTEKGMVTNISTTNYNVDLFFKAGAIRGQDITPFFAKAYEENPELALRMALWIRDCREGIGEKEHFRNILRYLNRSGKSCIKPSAIIEMGYWKDLLLILDNNESFSKTDKEAVLKAISIGLNNDALCAKWMPRKGSIANKIREYLNLSAKEYRKLLVNHTTVVETDMCANKWDAIKYFTVSSVAMNRYKKAFIRHTPEKFKEYIQSVLSGNEKINSSVLYPYTIINPILEKMLCGKNLSGIEKQTIIAQWNALPDYTNGKKILPLVDTSGSMTSKVANTSAIAIAISLGIYCADKNTGAFKDVFMNFSNNPTLQELKGDIVAKIAQLLRAEWGGTTNLIGAFNELLKFAIKNKVNQNDMPETIVIFSDMEFDRCAKYPNDVAFKAIKKEYKKSGYDVPKIVFWNIISRNSNFPVRSHTSGAALVSGFSPNIMKILFNIEEYTPEKVMIETLMKDRYDITKYQD